MTVGSFRGYRGAKGDWKFLGMNQWRTLAENLLMLGGGPWYPLGQLSGYSTVHRWIADDPRNPIYMVHLMLDRSLYRQADRRHAHIPTQWIPSQWQESGRDPFLNLGEYWRTAEAHTGAGDPDAPALERGLEMDFREPRVVNLKVVVYFNPDEWIEPEDIPRNNIEKLVPGPTDWSQRIWRNLYEAIAQDFKYYIPSYREMPDSDLMQAWATGAKMRDPHEIVLAKPHPALTSAPFYPGGFADSRRRHKAESQRNLVPSDQQIPRAQATFILMEFPPEGTLQIFDESRRQTQPHWMIDLAYEEWLDIFVY